MMKRLSQRFWPAWVARSASERGIPVRESRRIRDAVPRSVGRADQPLGGDPGREGDRLLEGVDETIRVAREAGIPAEIYHLKAAGEANWPKMAQAMLLALLFMTVACWAYALAMAMQRVRCIILEREGDSAWVADLKRRGGL